MCATQQQRKTKREITSSLGKFIVLFTRDFSEMMAKRFIIEINFINIVSCIKVAELRSTIRSTYILLNKKMVNIKASNYSKVTHQFLAIFCGNYHTVTTNLWKNISS